jgi:hypothetical protein
MSSQGVLFPNIDFIYIIYIYYILKVLFAHPRLRDVGEDN